MGSEVGQHGQIKPFKRYLFTTGFGGVVLALCLSSIIDPIGSVSGHPDMLSDTDYTVLINDDGHQYSLQTETKTVAQLLADEQIRLWPQDLVKPDLKSSINSPNFQIKISRAQPVTIIDDDETKLVYSAHKQARQIVTQAGIDLDHHDRLFWDDYRLERGDNDWRAIRIVRSKTYTIEFHRQKSIQTQTTAQTVGAILKQAGVDLQDHQSVYPTVGAKADPDQTILITELPYQVLIQHQAVEFDTLTSPDYQLQPQQKVVDQVGKNGIKEIAKLVFNDGLHQQPVEERIIASKIITQPTYHITRYGYKDYSDQIKAEKQKIAFLAGVKKSDWRYVNYIIRNESHWSSVAINKSSGAYGLCQSLPADKMASAGNDWRFNPLTQMKWCHRYAKSRYGGWQNAHKFWQANHWW